MQLFRPGAQPRSSAGTEVLNVHVRLANQFLKDVPISGFLEIANHGPLIAVVCLKMGGVMATLIAPVRVSLRTFDLDYIGSQVGKHHSGARTGNEGALLDHASAPQYLSHAHDAGALVTRTLRICCLQDPSPGTKPGGSGPS